MAQMTNSQAIKRGESPTLAEEPSPEALSADGTNLANRPFDRLRTGGKSDTGDSGPPTAAIHTHGCKLNQADSESLARSFADAGYRIVGWADGAD